MIKPSLCLSNILRTLGWNYLPIMLATIIWRKLKTISETLLTMTNTISAIPKLLKISTKNVVITVIPLRWVKLKITKMMDKFLKLTLNIVWNLNRLGSLSCSAFMIFSASSKTSNFSHFLSVAKIWTTLSMLPGKATSRGDWARKQLTSRRRKWRIASAREE